MDIHDRSRFYQCNNFSCEEVHRPGPIIDGREQLSIHVITTDMAQQLWQDSTEWLERQSAIRRLAGELQNFEEGKQYLSDSELDTLSEASRILGRLSTAIEFAKRKMKGLEEAEKSRLASQ